MRQGQRIGELLLERGVITPEQLGEALELQKERPKRLGEILMDMKAVDEANVLQALAVQLDLPYYDTINADTIDTEIISSVPINFAKQFKLMPLVRQDGHVVVATADPLDTFALDDLRILMNVAVDPVIAPTEHIINAINRVYDRRSQSAEDVMDDLEKKETDVEVEEIRDLLEESDDEAPIIRLVNYLMMRAVKERASDIHIEPFEKDLLVRFRVDGMLYEVMRPPKRSQASISSRIKIMGGLNIAEKRLPQDGRIRIKIAGKDIDIRLSTIPVAHGERLVMRLLDRSSILLDLRDIGFSNANYKIIESLIHRPHGIILVTGPTGSGKTTTLYACLSKINSPDKNILTVEDPVEYQLEGIGQMQINPKIDLTFASGLRHFLRQDPDVIMVGEIRDLETAEIAIQASLTGHMVLSTVHTNDSAGAMTRLTDMGVEPFLISSSIIGVLAQRLVRLVCQECREAYMPTSEELLELGLEPSRLNREGIQIYRAKGCPRCVGTGYTGRTGIYEMMVVDDEIRGLILKNVDSTSIKRAALQKGMLTLRDDGANKVVLGQTTIEEVMRVTQEDMD